MQFEQLIQLFNPVPFPGIETLLMSPPLFLFCSALSPTSNNLPSSWDWFTEMLDRCELEGRHLQNHPIGKMQCDAGTSLARGTRETLFQLPFLPRPITLGLGWKKIFPYSLISKSIKINHVFLGREMGSWNFIRSFGTDFQGVTAGRARYSPG